MLWVIDVKNEKMKFKSNQLQSLKIFISGLCLLLVTFVQPDITLNSNQIAQAETMSQTTLLLEMSSPSEMLDEMSSSSASKRVEGTADRVAGRAKRDVGEIKSDLSGVSDKLQGLAQEAEGKAKQDVAKVQDKLEQSTENLEDFSENVVDSIKDMFE